LLSYGTIIAFELKKKDFYEKIALMKTCPNQKQNLKDCPCTYESCPRKGICCECIKYHLTTKQLPACCFSKEAEKTYDRSFAKFIEDQS